MAVPKNKEELIQAIEEAYAKLKQDLETIPNELEKSKQLEGHAKDTNMSVSDLVAYLIGWAELVLKWHRKRENNEKVDFPEVGYKWNELGKLAQKFYEDYEELSYKSLLEKLEKHVNEILEIVKGATNEELYERSWYEKYTKGKMIQFNTSSPYKNARDRVRKWKKTLKNKNKVNH
ncbi:hypothetical protein SAMN04489761_3207 [Tenacibaculum sp. MAR_2009_124]|uniref:ClbS/DfsB family four-helix bundle protein n=1 Tax=Tenacibaculum sp. MAR_2009_124 TaxID=1250059 RepID=UPI00089D29CD|nr:ClbS/DfsB family four-helix bundle protein [Tenacibaculum sp. MAR_2009_124]SEC51701.1 hypothetical protein SAMN04489761_3207 [Tenacibaculum sp. MAR_2009_124]